MMEALVVPAMRHHFFDGSVHLAALTAVLRNFNSEYEVS